MGITRGDLPLAKGTTNNELIDYFVEAKRIPIAELKPAEYNPRIMHRSEFEGLKASILEFGQADAVVVNKDMTIIGGHMRVEAMKALGYKDVFCIVLDVDKRTEKKLNVTLNSQAISGNYDSLKLAEIIEVFKLDDNFEDLRLDVIEPLDLSEQIESEYEGMPEFSQDDQSAYRKLIINFKSEDDVQGFADLIGQNITEKTRSLWYPEAEIDSTKDISFR